MAEKNPDAAAQTMVSVVQFAALVELTVQRVYQLCRQDRSPRPTSKTDLSAPNCSIEAGG